MNCRPDSFGRLSLDIQDWHPRTTDPFARSHRVGRLGRGNLEGKGKVQDLPWRRWQSKHTDQQIKDTITNGSEDNPKMKPFKDKLTAEEIDSMVKFVRGLKAPARDVDR